MCQTPGLCRSLWSGLAGNHAGYATCNPSQPRARQQGAGISPLPEFSSVQLALFLQLSSGDMHLISAAPYGDKCLSPAAPHGRYALWSCGSLLERVTSVLQLIHGDTLHLGPSGIHSAGATVTRRGTVRWHAEWHPDLMEALLEEEHTGLSTVDRECFTNRICGADWAHVAGFGTHDTAVIASHQRVLVILRSVETGTQWVMYQS